MSTTIQVRRDCLDNDNLVTCTADSFAIVHRQLIVNYGVMVASNVKLVNFLSVGNGYTFNSKTMDRVLY